MPESDSVREHKERASLVFEVVIRLGVIFLLLFWGLRIVAPFLNPLVWGAILAVALYPTFLKLRGVLGGSARLAGVLFIVAGLALVVVPAGGLAAGSMEGVRALAERWQAGDLHIPPPPDRVQNLPVVGETLHARWLEASQNVEATIERFSPQLQALGSGILSLAASTGSALLLLAFSIVIAGILMIHGEACVGFATSLADRLIGDGGEEFLKLGASTIRGVAVGVIGTAAIQSAAAALGFIVMGIPLPGLFAALVLMFAVVQLPPIIVLLPIAIWAFTTHGTLAASLFLVWCILVAASDNVLKPMLMGRGQDVPMLVLLIGSIGGMLLSGILGLFVGAVVLAVIYRLFGAWMDAEGISSEAEATS